MDDEIKSAREIALEKVAKIGEPTEEERLKWKHVPEGEQLAARYLKENVNLTAELSRYPENVKKYILKGATGILARNIGLPANERARSNNRKAMEGIKTLKSDKVGVENVYSHIRQLFNHRAEQGEQQKKQAYEQLKVAYQAKVQQAVQKQMGTVTGARIDVERLPQFQQEWHNLQRQLESQYIKLLDEYKHELSEVN